MISPANFGIFVTTVNTMIGAAYATTPVLYDKFATEMPCNTTQLTLGWTGLMPKARPWFGPRFVHEPSPQTFTTVMIPFENTYGIDRFHLDDDQYGIYYRMLPDMARNWKRQPDFELRDLLEGLGIYAGVRQNGYDGLTAFNTAHPVDIYDSSKGTYSNDFIGGYSDGGTTVGGALSPVAFASALEYMQGYKGEDGEAMGVTPDSMMVPTTLQVEANVILKAANFAPPAWGAYSQIAGQVGTADNVLMRFGVEPFVNPLLKQKKRWYLMDTSRVVKPTIWAVREQPVTVPRTAETDPVVFDSHKFIWGGWDRAAPTWGPSWLMARSGP